MNRRIMLLSVSAVATPLLVNTATRSAQAQDAAAGTGTHRQMTLQYGALSKETSQLALQRAENARVKEFAGFEVNEQTTIAQVLTNRQDPTPPTLTSDNAAILQRLQSIAAGPAFDHAFVTLQAQVHQALLNVQNSFLNGQNAISTDAVHVAMLARTSITMHIQMLNDLQSVLRA